MKVFPRLLRRKRRVLFRSASERSYWTRFLFVAPPLARPQSGMNPAHPAGFFCLCSISALCSQPAWPAQSRGSGYNWGAMQLLPISIQARWLRLIALFLTAPLMSCAQLPIERLGFTPTQAREDLGYLIASVTTNGTGEAQFTFRRLNGTEEYHLSSRKSAYFSSEITVFGK